MSDSICLGNIDPCRPGAHFPTSWELSSKCFAFGKGEINFLGKTSCHILHFALQLQHSMFNRGGLYNMVVANVNFDTFRKSLHAYLIIPILTGLLNNVSQNGC